MSRTRLLLLVVLAALIWVWAASSTMPVAGGRIDGGPLAQGTAAASGAGRRPQVFDLQVTTERLTERRVAPTAAPNGERRNPFRFGADLRAPREPLAAKSTTVPGPVAPQAAAPPAVSLIGVVDRTVDGKAVRVAVLTMGEFLYFLSAGDRVGTRYEILAIAPEAVELKDLTDGSSRRVALK